ncbi:MAG: LysR substrate-binding domain-containing protein [Kiloniellaceae bacterium]
MTLEQLRIFVAVAEREHVTRASQDLGLTQSAVSAAITALERRYAIQLFDRIGRRIELTEAGRRFLRAARAVLAQAAAAETLLADLAGLKQGALSLAASQTVANYWLPPLMHRFRRAYPGVETTLTIGNTDTVAAMVHDGRVDLGFVEGALDDPILDVLPVADDELVLVASPDLVGAKPPRPTAAALAALPWVFREKGSGTRAIFEAAAADIGFDPAALQVALTLPTNEAVRAAVEAGAGVAALSRLAVAKALKAGTLAAFPLALPKRRFFAVRHRERHVSEAEREFMRLIDAA